MIIERPELLKEWLTCTLKKLSDADADALGKYILALVKKDKSNLKSMLMKQLEVFLADETSQFVELLLGTLLTKSYITKPIVPDDVVTKLSSTVDVASSEPTTNVKNTKTDIRDQTDILKDKELKTKSTNDPSFTDKFHSNSLENVGSKRKKVFDDKHNFIEKESCKLPADLSEDKFRPRSSSKGEVKYTPTGKESKPDYNSKLEPFPKKMKHDAPPHGDTDYRQRGVDLQQSAPLTENIPKPRECPSYFTNPSTRCKDYDEKGYCLRGNFCHFDHGSDPILVEPDYTPNQFLTSLKLVNFGGAEGTQSSLCLPPLPTSPPKVPPPPPPPLPPPPGFAAEAYNPEAPGMNMVTHLNFYNPSEPPPELPPMLNKSSMQMYFQKNDPYNKPKQGRTRELINVTKTVDSSNNSHSENKDDRTYLKPLNSGGAAREPMNNTHTYNRDFKAKRFDFSRLGPCPRSLEIRKIPRRLNTFKNLYDHFSKFGNIVNIEIAFDNDPEGAIISFSTNSEATAAYRSTEPILHNRFIKVFWSNYVERGTKRLGGVDANFSKEINAAKDLPSSLSPENPKGAQLENISQLNDGRVFEAKDKKVSENALSSKEVTPRSVYISNPLTQGGKVFTKLTGGAKKRTREQEEIATKHKLKLHQAKTQLLNSALEHQKLILDQLMKTKNKKQKIFLKETLDTISKKVEDLTKDLKKDIEECMKYTSQVSVSKIAAKELLDAELDLYKKQHTTHSDEDTTELLRKVNFMKTKAKALGLIESPAPKSVFRKNINSRLVNTLLSKPKNVLVEGKNSADDLKVEMQTLEVDDEEEEDKEEARSWRR